MLKKQIQLVVFDLDGTLVDAYEAVASSLNRALNKLNLPSVDDESIKRNVGWGERSLLGAFVSQENLDAALLIYREEHRKALSVSTKFMPGALELLSALKEKKYKLAIATNRPGWSTTIILKYLKIDHFFDYVLSADDIKAPKPSGEILLRVMEKLLTSAEDTLYVGDMTIDIETGNNAGVRTISVVTGSSTEQEIRDLKPFKIILNIVEVLDILEQKDIINLTM